MPESITVTIPDAIALNVTSPSPAGVSVLSPSASSFTVTPRDNSAGISLTAPDPISLIATSPAVSSVSVSSPSSNSISVTEKGPKGDTGAQGPQGPQGIQGPAGADGDGSEISLDLSPQLGGNLDVQARSLFTSTTNGDIQLTPNGTGSINLDGTVKFRRFSSPPTAFEGVCTQMMLITFTLGFLDKALFLKKI